MVPWLSLSSAFATVLLACKQNKQVINESFLRHCFRAEVVKTACDVFAGHNLILLAIRDGVITPDNFASFGGHTGYLQKNLYAPASKLIHVQDSCVIVAIIQHAKLIGILSNDSLENWQVPQESGSKNLYADSLLRVILQFTRCMYEVEGTGLLQDKNNGRNTEYGAADDSIKPSLMQDIWSMQRIRSKCISDLTEALSQLHNGIRETNPRTKYASLARCIILVFPVSELYLSDLRSTTLNLFIGLNTNYSVPGGLRAGRTTFDSMALVDVSNYINAHHLFSSDALARLNLHARTAILQSVRNSSFLDINHLQSILRAEITATNASTSSCALLNMGSPLWLRRCDTSTVSDASSSSNSSINDIARTRFRSETELRPTDTLTIPQCIPLLRELLQSNPFSSVSISTGEVEDLFFEFSTSFDCFVSESVFIHILSALRAKHSRRTSAQNIIRNNLQRFLLCAQPQRMLSVRMAARVFCSCLSSPDNGPLQLASDYRTVFDLLKPFDDERVGTINEVQFLKFMKSYYGPLVR